MERIPSNLPLSSGHGQMTEMAIDHGGERYTGTGAAFLHLHGSGHQIANRRGARIGVGQRHLAQDITLCEGPAKLGVNDGNGSDVMVEHFIEGICDGSIERHRRNLPIA